MAEIEVTAVECHNILATGPMMTTLGQGMTKFGACFAVPEIAKAVTTVLPTDSERMKHDFGSIAKCVASQVATNGR